MNKLATALVIGMSILFMQTAVSAQKAASSTAESAGIDQDVELLRSDIRSAKKKIIAENMNLTGAEAEKYWPV